MIQPPEIDHRPGPARAPATPNTARTTMSVEHLRALAGGLRSRLGMQVAAGFLTAAEANDMLARLDRLIAQHSRTGDAR